VIDIVGLIITFAYIRKRIGEVRDPCGRQALKGFGVSLRPSKQKDKVLSDVKAVTQSVRYCGIWRWHIACTRLGPRELVH
jgi:hypothetical protein